ncbi:MAG: GntR family transcriptional regulator [Eubacterium sp.]|nr:GntR family transcriptional regulator [Eubacterium sp.]
MAKTRNTRTKIDVYRLIKDKIQFLDLMPGQVIKESELIEQLGVSRTPIREALIRLSSEYLIEIYPQRGTYVSNINFGIARECAYMRHILDTNVCRELCRKKADLHDVLEDSLFFLQKAVNRKDVVEYIKNDNNFHRIIFRTAGHEMTWEIISDSRAHYNRVLTLDLRREGILEKSLHEHQEMVELIASGDEKNLLKLLDVHHDYTHMPQREQELRAAFPAYFENE